MKQYKINIPVNYNDGTQVPVDLHANTTATAMAEFGGYTFDPNLKMGGWADDEGNVYQEHMMALYIASDDPVKVHDFVEKLKAQYDQKAMYVVTMGAVEFV